VLSRHNHSPRFVSLRGHRAPRRPKHNRDRSFYGQSSLCQPALDT